MEIILCGQIEWQIHCFSNWANIGLQTVYIHIFGLKITGNVRKNINRIFLIIKKKKKRSISWKYIEGIEKL